MKIGIHYNKSNKITGCWKVANNLMSGLKELDISFSENKIENINGQIHGNTIINDLPKNSLIGPEIVVLPTENKILFEKYKYWTQPSNWVIDYYKTFDIVKNNIFYSWEVGIDTQKFNPYNVNPEIDCIIYFKNITKQNDLLELEKIEILLREKNLKYKVVKYGDYKEEDFIKLLKTCVFAIWYVGTESQNIALMEVLSCGIPIYVIDQELFEYKDFKWKGATSAPYFNNKCGIKEKHINKKLLDLFIYNLPYFKPREYILENHTLKKGAEKYINILRNINE